MKLVIEIDEKTYNEIMDDAKNTPRNLSHYERIIAKGTPLDKIRADIEQIADEEQKHDEKWAIGLRYAIKIIDKYKAESEVRDADRYIIDGMKSGRYYTSREYNNDIGEDE